MVSCLLSNVNRLITQEEVFITFNGGLSTSDGKITDTSTIKNKNIKNSKTRINKTNNNELNELMDMILGDIF